MNYLVIAGMAVAGLVLGPLLRAEIVRHAVPVGQAPLEDCPRCHGAIARRTRFVARVPLPPSGRCPHCGHLLGPPSGSVEVVAAGTLAILAWRVGDPLALLGLSWAALTGIVLSFVDIRVHRLPNRLVLTGLAGTLLGLTVAAAWHRELPRLGLAVVCACATAVAYLLLALLPASYGLGDAKFAALTGTAAGWYGVGAALGAFVTGLVLAGLVAVVILASGSGRSRGSLAHGPFMCAGTMAAILVATVSGPA